MRSEEWHEVPTKFALRQVKLLRSEVVNSD